MDFDFLQPAVYMETQEEFLFCRRNYREIENKRKEFGEQGAISN